MGITVYPLLWVMQDLYHQPKDPLVEKSEALSRTSSSAPGKRSSLGCPQNAEGFPPFGLGRSRFWGCLGFRVRLGYRSRLKLQLEVQSCKAADLGVCGLQVPRHGALMPTPQKSCGRVQIHPIEAPNPLKPLT